MVEEGLQVLQHVGIRVELDPPVGRTTETGLRLDEKSVEEAALVP